MRVLSCAEEEAWALRARRMLKTLSEQKKKRKKCSVVCVALEMKRDVISIRTLCGKREFYHFTMSVEGENEHAHNASECAHTKHSLTALSTDAEEEAFVALTSAVSACASGSVALSV